jgi:heme-degrading monooxygenase HmoA
MIKRIVKMTFRDECRNHFITFFEERKSTIRGFEGCTYLELWQDVHNPNVFFTHSNWESEAYLNAYRNSDFFEETWKATKAMFEEKAQAWSVSIVA